MTAPLDFTFKSFEEMTPADYAIIGLKAGLEIHQQLKTRRKLFCRCPAGCYTHEVDAEILRHMRPTLSELGEYDGTALMEFKTKKEIVYLLKNESVCTYEMDDAPPFEMDPEAIRIALEVSLLYNLNLVSEIHIARKQYLDGSIPTGFQRTTILGVDGEVPFKNRTLHIIQLGLEEDSCREVSDVGHRITFRTDRLGMPLIETVTYPELTTPEEVAEAAELLSSLVRSTGHVRTGAGAAREDVNVSINGGTRIEIKGVPSIKRIPRLVYNEARRQHNLLKIREELKSRNITPETFEHGHADVTGILHDTSYIPIRQAVKEGKHVAAVRLKGFKGILAHPTQEHTFFGQEISDRVKVIACLMDHPNILHSDSTDPGISRGQWNRIRKRLRGNGEDSFVVVWGSNEDLQTAIQEIAIRAKEATEGVPSETRQAFRDGTQGFERILPGANRMYPDTDEPPISIPDEMVETVRAALPETPWKRVERLRELGLDDTTIEILADSALLPLFDAVMAQYDNRMDFMVKLIRRDLRGWTRRGRPVKRIDADVMGALFDSLRSGKLLPEAVTYILDAFLDAPESGIQAAIERFTPTGGEKAELDRLVGEAKHLQHDLKSVTRQGRQRYFMGQILSDNGLRGRVAAAIVAERLWEVMTGDDER